MPPSGRLILGNELISRLERDYDATKKYHQSDYSKDEKPIFITTTSALRYCNILLKYRADSSRFPLVSEILSTNLEDRDSFHKRRLRWAVIEMKRTRTPISGNKLRKVADLEIKVLYRHKDFILSIVNQIGGEVNDRSFLS